MNSETPKKHPEFVQFEGIGPGCILVAESASAQFYLKTIGITALAALLLQGKGDEILQAGWTNDQLLQLASDTALIAPNGNPFGKLNSLISLITRDDPGLANMLSAAHAFSCH